jgi:hypothetical protein
MAIAERQLETWAPFRGRLLGHVDCMLQLDRNSRRN